jgi:hypothetical protein
MQLAVWRKRGVISLGSSYELPNDKNLVEAASAPRLRQAAETLGDILQTAVYMTLGKSIKKAYLCTL